MKVKQGSIMGGQRATHAALYESIEWRDAGNKRWSTRGVGENQRPELN
jgi:hypothetical protein